jgi:hypothetical protein
MATTLQVLAERYLRESAGDQLAATRALVTYCRDHANLEESAFAELEAAARDAILDIAARNERRTVNCRRCLWRTTLRNGLSSCRHPSTVSALQHDSYAEVRALLASLSPTPTTIHKIVPGARVETMRSDLSTWPLAFDPVSVLRCSIFERLHEEER